MTKKPSRPKKVVQKEYRIGEEIVGTGPNLTLAREKAEEIAAAATRRGALQFRIYRGVVAVLKKSTNDLDEWGYWFLYTDRSDTYRLSPADQQYEMLARPRTFPLSAKSNEFTADLAMTSHLAQTTWLPEGDEPDTIPRPFHMFAERWKLVAAVEQHPMSPVQQALTKCIGDFQTWAWWQFAIRHKQASEKGVMESDARAYADRWSGDPEWRNRMRERFSREGHRALVTGQPATSSFDKPDAIGDVLGDLFDQLGG